ncbi:MAG: RNA methyltransferase [Deltaproteobacteria bacterium]|nr:MAG: RNA methyltransferase [Deltaproteobacteria bacterium]
MNTKTILSNIGIILVEPQIPENIGSAARAMANMGLERLILVRPKNCDLSRILKTATGSSWDVVETLEVFDDLETAIAPFHYLAGSTARLGSLRPALTTPRLLARDLISISQENEVGLVFGPEDRGLSNKELHHCHTIVNIPTAGFSSLNLAHAVMILCYEISIASTGEQLKPVPRLANSFELEGMYNHMQQVLMKIGFLLPENPEHWMLNIRRYFSRLPLRAREVRIIRGICRQIDWYTSHIDKNDAKKKRP